jgi:uncharacterized protein YkwD
MRKILALRLFLLLPLIHLLALAQGLTPRPLALDASPDPLPPPLAAQAIDSVPAPAAMPAAPVASPAFADQVMELVNEARWTNGELPPLKRDASLDQAALTHSQNMAARDFFAHCDPDTLTWPGDRMSDAGYSWNGAAENIAAGYSSAAAVMAGWMASSGHRANILSTSYRELGIGYEYQGSDLANVREDEDNDCTPDLFNQGPYGHYWTQNFGRRNAVYPVVIEREAFETTDRNVNLYVYGPATAAEMRFRDQGGSWSAWIPFQHAAAWTLAAGDGFKVVESEIRTGGGGTVYSASDGIWLAEAGGDTPTPLPTSSATQPPGLTPSVTSLPSPTPMPSGTPAPAPVGFYGYLAIVRR